LEKNAGSEIELMEARSAARQLKTESELQTRESSSTPFGEVERY
jgi:hypothetical protein